MTRPDSSTSIRKSLPPSRARGARVITGLHRFLARPQKPLKTWGRTTTGRTSRASRASRKRHAASPSGSSLPQVSLFRRSSYSKRGEKALTSPCRPIVPRYPLHSCARSKIPITASQREAPPTPNMHVGGSFFFFFFLFCFLHHPHPTRAKRTYNRARIIPIYPAYPTL